MANLRVYMFLWFFSLKKPKKWPKFPNFLMKKILILFLVLRFRIRNVPLLVSFFSNDESTMSQKNSSPSSVFLPPFIDDMPIVVSFYVHGRFSSFMFVFCSLFLLHSLYICFIKMYIVVIVVFYSFLAMIFIKLLCHVQFECEK